MARIGIALSGGGHRAAAWGLGSLLAFTDMGLSSEVVSISSVSGGSIANGIAAQLDFASTGSTAFEDGIRAAARNMASDGLFFPGPSTDAWVVGFVASVALFVDLALALAAATLAVGRDWTPLWFLVVGLALAAVAWAATRRRLPGKVWKTLTAVLALAGPLAVAAVALTTSATRSSALLVLVVLFAATAMAGVVAFRGFAGRSLVVEKALARVHYSRADGDPMLLSDVDGRVHHVFCATDLQSGDHFYLTPRLVSGYRVGKGVPASMTLARAVQCSACLPGAFAPRRLDTADFRLSRAWEVDGGDPPDVPATIVLDDGGVYDNMADQWEQGIKPRLDRVGPVQEPAEELVLVNASASMRWTPYPRSSVANEVNGISRVGSILYDVSTSHRRHALVASFKASAALGEGLRGAVVNIAQSPYDVPTRYGKGADAAGDRARTALAALATLARSPAEWKALARSNPGVATTLGPLTPSVTADLLEHAWVLTVVNVYVVLGYGEDVIANLAALGKRSRFEAICG